MFVAVICVPWMLLSKPIYLLVKHKRAVKKSQVGTLLDLNVAIVLSIHVVVSWLCWLHSLPCQGYRRHVNSPLGSESETTDDNEVTHHDEEKGKHFPEMEEEEQVGIGVFVLS